MTTLKNTLERQLNNEPIVEMSRINTKERKIFPYDSWKIVIWSNDHEPAHFHVISEGWNVTFEIPSGKLLEIKTKGKKESVFEYIMDNIQKWLSSKCALIPSITNAENAEAQWAQIHDEY